MITIQDQLETAVRHRQQMVQRLDEQDLLISELQDRIAAEVGMKKK